jgi:hypothetical protein
METRKEEHIYLRVKRGYGTHTTVENRQDGAGKDIRVPVIHRHSDEEAFTLPISAYQEFPEKFEPCNPDGSRIEPVVKTVPLEDKIKAATKRTAKR